MLQDIAQRFPDQKVVQMFLIDSLLVNGDVQSATQTACKISDEPDQLLRQVPAIVAELGAKSALSHEALSRHFVRV